MTALRLVTADRAAIAELMRATERSDRRAAQQLLKQLPIVSHDYTFSRHYFLFTCSYLQDEGVLADLDLGYDLSHLVKERLKMIPRRASRLPHLIDGSLDVGEMREEFHGGGPQDDPKAPEALTAAVATLYSSLRLLDEGQVLVVRF